MRDLFRLIGWAVVDLLRSRAALEAEIWTLRQQINVLRRTGPKRLSFSVFDRLVFVGLYRLFPKICDALAIVKPDTIVGWHRADFRLYWRWKSRRRSGRHEGATRNTPADPRDEHRKSTLGRAAHPRRASQLGIDIGQSSVAKYMVRRRGPPSQGWNTFIRNHADGIAAMDLFVVPTRFVCSTAY